MTDTNQEEPGILGVVVEIVEADGTVVKMGSGYTDEANVPWTTQLRGILSAVRQLLEVPEAASILTYAYHAARRAKYWLEFQRRTGAIGLDHPIAHLMKDVMAGRPTRGHFGPVEGLRLTMWLPTQPPDAVQMQRMTQLCELVTLAIDPEPDEEGLRKTDITEMYFDRATDMIYSKALLHTGETRWTCTDPNCQGIFG